MNINDPSTYYRDERAYATNNSFGGQERGYVHKGGNEIECNLSGRYIHMVSDMSEEIGNEYELSICSVGLIGEVPYRRDEPVPETIEVIKEDFPTTLYVQNVSPAHGLAVH